MATWAMTSATAAAIPAEVKSFTGLKASAAASSAKPAALSVSNGSRVSCMLVWPPYNNTKYETLSYVPALSADQIAKQVDYITSNGWVPCLEFDNDGQLFREHSRSPGYYDGRYWTMWKLPMFGCTDSAAVLNEINECKKAYPDAFIRLLSFDSKRQVQVSCFLVSKPSK